MANMNTETIGFKTCQKSGRRNVRLQVYRMSNFSGRLQFNCYYIVTLTRLYSYKKLLKSVRSLDEQYAMLEEKEAFYSSLVAFVKDDDDNPRPAVKNATSKKDKSVEKNGKQGEPAQQKKKKQKQIDQ